MKRTIFTILFFISTLFLYAQVEINMNGIDSIHSCDLILYDHGGTNGAYGNNRNDIFTIYSNDPSNNAVLVEITSLDIDESDTLYIYNGTTASPNLLLKKINNSNYYPLTHYIYSASIQNTAGAITVKFVSDGNGVGEGFSVKVSCIAPCQRIYVQLDTNNCTHVPHLDDDGYYYIDVCPYDTVHLEVKGEYVDNDYSYHQSDNLSRFIWDFDLFDMDSVGLNAIDYYFTPGRGYDLSISIIDQSECFSLIPVSFRVRTSKNPIRDVAHFDPMCSGDELALDVGYDNLSSIQLDSVGSEQITSLGVVDTIFLPDGISCPPYGYFYRSYVNFSSFAPNATINNANDILFVRLKIEHSAIEDIRITLVCPNGNACKIVPDYQNDGWGNVPHSFFRLNMGVAYRPDVLSCDPTDNNMGEAWNYIWSNNTQQGYQYAGGTYGFMYEPANVHTVYNPHWDAGTSSYSIDSSDKATMSQIYHPLQNFSGMIGCPLNGSWYIEVQDLWTNDNGFLHEWEMSLDPSLLPQNWSYNVNIDTVLYSGPGAHGQSIVPPYSGNHTYTATIIDDFGCNYDTTFNIEIIQSPFPDLGDDATLCAGEMINLSPHFDSDSATYLWNTGATTEEIFVLTEGMYCVRMSVSTSADDLVCWGEDTVYISINPQPTADFISDITQGCVPQTIHFEDNSLPAEGNLTYEWRIFNINGFLQYSSNVVSPVFEIEEPGTYHVQLVIKNQAGCVDSLMRWNYLQMYAQPISAFSAMPEISYVSDNDGSVIFTNYCDSVLYFSDPTIEWQWDFGDESTEASIWSPTHQYSTWGDYVVSFEIETEYGCKSAISHIVVLEERLEFPNVITPNGDEYNDVFAIKNLNTEIDEEDPDGYRRNQLVIYDRWGKEVYRASDYDTYMREDKIVKGTRYFDGEGLSGGEYYFSFSYKGKMEMVHYSGSLMIAK